MSIVGRLGTAAGAKMLTTTGARSATRARSSPTTKGALVVAVALLLALAALLSASDAPNAARSYSSAARSTPDRSGARAPQIRKREALDAYEKSFLF